MPLGNKTSIGTYDEKKKNLKLKLLWFDIYVIS